jgi:hypothetical protein
MKKLLSTIFLLVILALCCIPPLLAASNPKYIGGTLAQGAAPDPSSDYDFFSDTAAVGYFPLSGKIWFEFTSPVDCTGWILSTQDRTTKRGFPIYAKVPIRYLVNPAALFFGYSGAVGGHGKSQ